jgi:putative tricarboxylic transport membrane protein
MPWADRALAVVMLAVSGVWAYLAFKLPFPAFARASKVGPGRFPAAVSILMGVLALILLVKTFIPKPDRVRPDEGKSPRENDESSEKTNKRHLAIGFCLFTAYVLLTPLMGFIPSSILFILGMVRIVGAMSWLKCGMTAVIITTFLWVIFVYWLQVPLPTGPMGV